MKRNIREIFLRNIKNDNRDRNMYYGLRKGDVITDHTITGTIIGYGILDNNKVFLKTTNGIRSVTAEKCSIITKVIN